MPGLVLPDRNYRVCGRSEIPIGHRGQKALEYRMLAERDRPRHARCTTSKWKVAAMRRLEEDA